jgi:hypothetical protein
MWADSDTAETPEREDAEAAVADILRILGIQAAGAPYERAVQRVILASGLGARRNYDLGWQHCEASLRE